MDIKDILKHIALQNGVSEEEAREKIQQSIHEACLQKAPAFVNTFGDREPSVEELLEEMANQIMGAF